MNTFLKFLICLSVGISPFFAVRGAAQPTPESSNSTQTNISELAPEQFLINGGVLSNDGRNLFHGFEQFNLTTEQTALFLNQPNALNLFSKISGGNPSYIDGLIGVLNGNPNLYFINPAGIIFGENIQLNVPNDFVATTATGLGFGNSWLNAVGNSDFANLVGEPTQFSFNTNGVVGDILVQGDLDTPIGDLALIGGRVQGDRRISSSENLLITTVPDQGLVRLQQPGNLLSLELDTASLDHGNGVNFSIQQFPQLLTGSGEIQLHDISAKYGVIAADGQLTLNNSSLQTDGHLALLGQGITTNSTTSNSGLNQLLISGELAESYQAQKPFLEAIANRINFTIESDPIDGTPIIVTDNLIDNVGAETLNTADIYLEKSQFTGQYIYLLGDNIDLIGSDIATTENLSLFALDTATLSDTSTHALDLSSRGILSLRGNDTLTVDFANHPNSKITSSDNILLSAGDLNLQEAVVETQNNLLINANDVLIQNSQLTSGQNLKVSAANSLLLEDIPDRLRDATFNSDLPLRLIAGNELRLESGDILRAIAPKENSIFQAGTTITAITPGEQIELLGNFKSSGDIQIGDLTTGEILIEGGVWQADQTISLLAEKNVILQDFHETRLGNYGSFDSPLNISANEITLVGNDLIELYLGDNSGLSSTDDLAIFSEKINLVGSLTSAENIIVVADDINLGINTDRLDDTNIADILILGELPAKSFLKYEDFWEASYFGGDLTAEKDIVLFANNILTLADLERKPLNLAGDNVVLQGLNRVSLDAANDPTSQIVATGDVSVLSDNYIGRVGLLTIGESKNILFSAPEIVLQGSLLNASQSISFDAAKSLSLSKFQVFRLKSLPFQAIAPEINFSPSNNIRIDLSGVEGSKIRTEADLILDSAGDIYLSGDIATSGEFIVTAAGNIDVIQPKFTVGGNLRIAAGDRLFMEDIKGRGGTNELDYSPLQFLADGNITLQGNNAIEIPSYDSRSFIQSGGDTTLVSDGLILSNLEYRVGNDFSVEDLAGQPTDWQSVVDVNNTLNQFLSVYFQEGEGLVPIGQVNLAEVYAEGDIRFGDFNGRSLILEAGETITANEINIYVPVAFGYANDEPTIRTRNFPDQVLSITGGKNFTEPAQALFIGTSLIPLPAEPIPSLEPGLPAPPIIFEPSISVGGFFPLEEGTFDLDFSEVDQLFEAVSLNDPLIPLSFSRAIAVGFGDGTFISNPEPNEVDSPEFFILNPPNARLLSSVSGNREVNSLGVNLKLLDNPLENATNSNPNSVAATGLRGSGLTQDLTGQNTKNSDGITVIDGQTDEIKIKTAETCVNDDPRQKSLTCQQEELRLARLTGNTTKELFALDQLGFFYYRNNHYQDALKAYQERLTLAENLENTIAEVQSLQGLTQTYSALGDYQTARVMNRRALALVSKIVAEDPEVLIPLKQSIASNFGFIAYAQEGYPIAVKRYQQSLELARQSGDRNAEIEVLSQLGLSYFQQTDYQAAKSIQEQALALAQTADSKLNQLRAYEGLAIAEYALENYDVAIQNFEQALALAEQLGDRHAQARNWSAIGDTQHQIQQNAIAITSLENAIQLWEELRQDLGAQDLFRVSLFETQESTYSTLQKVLIESGQFTKALEITERGRSRAFVELLEDSNSPQADEQDIEAPDIDQMRQIAADQQATLVSYAIAREVVEQRGQRDLVNSEIWIWVVQPSGTVDFRRQDLQSLTAQGLELDDLVSASRCFGDRVCLLRSQTQQVSQGLVHADNAAVNFDPNLNQLHDLLIAPIQDLLPTAPEQEVVFVPHRSLFLVPFAALQDDTGRYLIEDHTIRTAPSIQVLDLTRQQRQTVSGQGITIVGNPTMPKELEQLPGTEKEALAIAAMFDTDIITGDEATPTLVTQSIANSRFIHLATHGLLDGYGDNDVQKRPGAIALAPTEVDDGFLTASEILELDLNSEMVVLSACDTGRGTITEDGVIGLSRSFMGAGVPSVVVSLWQVPDESTSDLMIEFYEQLRQNPNKAQALRQAMLVNLKKYGQPIDWAGFTLMGET
ncbi:filamentous hemagglutinin family outer membrane protein [[Leptolyngbya] sp. PCC 7376]|uniref:CHAT domain-containing protein n=1 Tax=[Leptolyngbya] sp. PCC 7376 TaxID=111781 RepID=UPI00029F3A21|nr:CHAT domain-containing protein [[Leptolyngbya] sp. PCC 7376]AFY38246.1 filamentous hemagglutinin family outer membrane protein [[Leptolyngbya] sp. PCC 7376]